MMQFENGPVMEGTWWNPKTGHKFTVRDSFFQDGIFTVMTTDGRMLDYNMIQDYVQYIGKDQDEVYSKPNLGTINNLPPEVADLIEPALPADWKPTVYETPVEPKNTIVDYKATIVDYDIIDRVLKDHPVPGCDVKLNWLVPSAQLSTLTDILHVDASSIIEYYISKIDIEGMKKAFEESIRAYLTPKAPEETPKPVEKSQKTIIASNEVMRGPKEITKVPNKKKK